MYIREVLNKWIPSLDLGSTPTILYITYLQIFHTEIWNFSEALQVTCIKLNSKPLAENASSEALVKAHLTASQGSAYDVIIMQNKCHCAYTCSWALLSMCERPYHRAVVEM